MTQVDFWNNRYGEDSYAYGITPNLFFSAELEKLAPGKVLFPAEGEGRNAVFAASLGWDVVAFDSSEAGKKKALKLAAVKGVQINYNVVSLSEFVADPESFDALVLIYAHFPSDLREIFHRKLSRLVKPGGRLILEGFSKEHLKYSSVNVSAGGPKDLSMLFSLEELTSDFSDFDFQLLEEKNIHLNEGRYHAGEAAVLRLHGIKKVL